MHEIKPQNEDYLSEEEKKEALDTLTQADLLRLAKVAGRFAGRGRSGDDLLQEAVMLVMDGTRAWKRGMRTAPFLFSAMRSIADAGFKKKSPENDTKFSFNEEGNDNIVSVDAEEYGHSAEALLVRAESEAENEKSEKEMLDKIFELFRDHEHATWVLIGQMDDKTVDEVCAISGMTRTEYASARRHIRRTLDKEFPNGRRTS